MSCAIVGATGAVGLELIKCCKFYDFPAPDLYASARSKGKEIDVENGFDKPLVVQVFDAERIVMLKYDFIFLAVSGDFSLEHAKKLASEGAVVIDNR